MTRSRMPLQHVAAAFGFEGEVLPEILLAERVVNVVVRGNQEELRRRKRHRVSPVREQYVLEELSRLPQGSRLPGSMLDPFTRTILQTLPEGIVRWTDGSIERVWTPALSITGFFVQTNDWRRGLRRVSLFAADGPRALVYEWERAPRQLLREAESLGVGVGVLSNTGVLVVLEPDRSLALAGVPQWDLLEELLPVYLKEA